MEDPSYSVVRSTVHPFHLASGINSTLNSSTDYDGNGTGMGMPGPDPYGHSFRIYLEIVLLVVIGICGLIGNGTLIYSVLLNKEMRSVPNVLIANVAIGDLLLLASSVPLTILSYIQDSFGFGETVCKFQAFIPVLSAGISVFTFTALSYDRYNAIVRPMHRRRSPVVRRTCAVAVGIWIVAICFGMPSLIFAELKVLRFNDTEFIACFHLPHFTVKARVYEVTRCLVMYVIPLSVITCYYCLIAIQLFQSSRDMPGEGHQESKQAMARRRLAKAVLVLVFIFGICWFPHFVRR